MLFYICLFFNASVHASGAFATDPNFTPTAPGSASKSSAVTLDALGGLDAGSSGGSSAGGGSSGGAGGSSGGAHANPDDVGANLASGSSTGGSQQTDKNAASASDFVAAASGAPAATQPASLETQQSVLSSAASAATPQSSTQTTAKAVSGLSSPTQDDGSAASNSTSSSSSSSSAGSLSPDVTNIRTALFGATEESAEQKLSEDTLYRYYQWMVVRQEAASLRKAFVDPLGTKTLGYSLATMFSSVDPSQSVLGTYSLIYGDTMNWGLQVNTDPVILPMNMLVSQLLNAVLFPVIQPTSDLSGYAYSTPEQNLSNNKPNLSYHAQQLADLVSKQGPLFGLAQNYIYFSALGLQLKSCAAQYQPASNASASSPASSSISALTNALGASTGGTTSSYFLIPPDTDLSTYTNGLTGMTAVTCSANICSGGAGQGCPPVGSNYDAQGNGFPGILNVLNLLSQSISVNPQTDTVAAENASMALLSNQQYKGNDLPDILGCMNAVSIFGEKAIIKCQAANVSVIDMMSAYYAEKTNQTNLGGDLSAQGISSGTADGLNFVKKMGGKVGIVMKRMNDLLPIVAASSLYQSSYQYFLTQVVPSATLAHMPGQELTELNQVFSVTPPHTSVPANAQNWFNTLMSKISTAAPAPKNETGGTRPRSQPPVRWTGSQFLFGQQADSNDLLVAMSSQSFMESLLSSVMSTPYIAGLPIPKNTVDAQGRLYQWVSLAGSFYLLSSDGTTGSWFRSKTLNTTGVTKYQIAVSSAAAGESMWNQRKTYLAALSKAIAQQNNIVMHDASVQSWALTQIKNYEYERSVQYNYQINQTNKGSDQSSSGQSYTPMQILTEIGRWRLNPSYRWRDSLDRMDTDQLLRELLYLVSEQQMMMTRLILDVEDMKLMKAVDFYNNGASTANNMGMGPLADIQNSISNYVAGSSSGNFSMSNMQQMQEDTQQSMSDALQAAQSVNPTSTVNSMLPSSLTGSSDASSAASVAMPSS